ncbi:MAG: dihydropteroate synthase [Vicinamibacterales bacterium]
MPSAPSRPHSPCRPPAPIFSTSAASPHVRVRRRYLKTKNSGTRDAGASCAARSPHHSRVHRHVRERCRAAIGEGASIVNDISALQYDQAMASTVADGGAALVLMHTRGRSADMYARAIYDDVVREVTTELRTAIDAAASAGIDRTRIIVDPGIGFAKRAAHSYVLLARLAELSAQLARPVLAGPSRKSFMREALAERPAVERDWGTAAAVTAAVLGGAHLVRVHAVPEMVQVARVAEAIRQHGALDKIGSTPL